MRPITPARLRELTAPERQQKAAQLIPARRCLVCRSQQRAEIEAAWLNGATLLEVSRQFPAIAYGTIVSHWRKGHPADTLGADFKGHFDSRTLTEILQSWLQEIEGIYDEAREDKDHKIALKAIEQIGQFLERYGKATGEIKQGDTNIRVQIGSEQAQRMVGAANELELAVEYERRALLLRERWKEKVELAARTAPAFAESTQTIEDAVVVPP